MKNPHFVRIQKILGPLVRFLFPISLEGTENLPEDRPVMLCANHSSAWDPVLFVAAIRTGYPLRIMAKKQLLNIPILGHILQNVGAFAVDRGNSDIIIGRPYTPVYTGRKGTAEEYQANADEIMRRAYALGGIVCR